MNITLEIDNINRFITIFDENQNQTRIRYEDYDYLIFPLIMFKVHIQFDTENDIISFYINDVPIIEVKKKMKIKTVILNGFSEF